MATTDSLTERESQALQHLQKAQELGSTLTEYCSAFGAEVKELYAIKQQLVRKGVLPGMSKAEAPEQANPFVPVRIVPSTRVDISRYRVPPGASQRLCD